MRLLLSLRSSLFTDRSRSAQVMIITVLTLGGTLLGATTIAGLLMLYQIRQATDLKNSAQAIFAADTGIEWGLYRFFQCNGNSSPPSACDNSPPPQTFDNKATFELVCTENPDGTTGWEKETCETRTNTPHLIKSIGQAAATSRAFLEKIEAAPAP